MSEKPSLRARALAGDRLLGTLLRMPAEEVVEMTALAGMDFVLIDCEHGPADVVTLRQHIATAAMYGMPVMVRIGLGDEALALRALDQGAEGILSPHTDSAALSQALVDAVHYPPLGRRGFATYSRAGRFGDVPGPEHKRKYLENTLTIGMIESPDAVRAADEIIAVEGIDGIMIGPADLAAVSGPGDPSLAEQSATVHRALTSAGKLRMDIVNRPVDAAAAFEEGAGLVVYNLAYSLMSHFRELVAIER